MHQRDDFKIVHKKRQYAYTMPIPHEHPYYELGYTIEGIRKVFINHTVYVLREGDLVLVRKNEIHRAMQYEDSGTNGINLIFSDNYLQPVIERYGKERVDCLFEKRIFHFELKNKRNIEKLMHAMIFEYRHPDDYIHHSQELFVQELFIQLLRWEERNREQEVNYETIDNQRMQEAAKYISRHFHKDLKLPDVAMQYGVSTSYFAKKFKAVTGFSFKEYLTAVRIREASSLLIQSNMSITEVAIKCGFSDSNYFGDVFKKVKGVSPRAYRKVSGFI